MNLPEALELLNYLLRDSVSPLIQDDANAVILGIEALKRIQLGRAKGYNYFNHLLPGETNE